MAHTYIFTHHYTYCIEYNNMFFIFTNESGIFRKFRICCNLFSCIVKYLKQLIDIEYCIYIYTYIYIYIYILFDWIFNNYAIHN